MLKFLVAPGSCRPARLTRTQQSVVLLPWEGVPTPYTFIWDPAPSLGVFRLQPERADYCAPNYLHSSPLTKNPPTFSFGRSPGMFV